MPWIARSGALVSSCVLLACPQLLSDSFEMAPRETPFDGNHLTCTRSVCEDASVPPAPAAVDGGRAELDAGNGGAATSLPPEPDLPDAATSPPSDEAPACWKVVLNDRTQIASNNCLGIHGWNDAVSDTSTGSTVTETFQQGNICLAGNVAASGWGVVYSLTLANEAIWDATAQGVTGFAFSFEGSGLPPEAEVIYTQTGNDYCRKIVPAGEVEVPFHTTHPGCSTTSISVPNPTSLTFIRMHLPVVGPAYAFDFCLGLRAVP